MHIYMRKQQLTVALPMILVKAQMMGRQKGNTVMKQIGYASMLSHTGNTTVWTLYQAKSAYYHFR